MTKSAIRRELRNIRYELNWLAKREQEYNPDWRFKPSQYSKRHKRLVKAYWALKTKANRYIPLLSVKEG